MKNFCVLHILLFLLLMLLYQCADAQDYVVLAKGDTIRGTVKPLNYGPEKKVQVNVGKEKNVYSIFQTRAYTFKGETFEPVKNDKGYQYMKQLKSGYLSLYAFQMENQVSYDGLLLKKKDGTFMEVPNLTFKKQMLRFLEDCEVVTARIDNGDLGKKNLEQIVDEYNTCIHERTQGQQQAREHTEAVTKKTSPWDDLETKVKEKEFAGKNDALEMITEIKGKIKRDEKVPKFLVEGLKTSLADANLATELETALAEIKN